MLKTADFWGTNNTWGLRGSAGKQSCRWKSKWSLLWSDHFSCVCACKPGAKSEGLTVCDGQSEWSRYSLHTMKSKSDILSLMSSAALWNTFSNQLGGGWYCALLQILCGLLSLKAVPWWKGFFNVKTCWTKFIIWHCCGFLKGRRTLLAENEEMNHNFTFLGHFMVA